MDRARAARRSPGERSHRDPWRSDEAVQPAQDDVVDEHERDDEDEATRARREKIERLAADVDLHMRLALIGFTGPEYHEFQTELTRYGLDVMTGWLRTGKIFAKMRDARLGIAHHPTALSTATPRTSSSAGPSPARCTGSTTTSCCAASGTRARAPA